MCNICATVRPFEPDCAYDQVFALIQEGADAPANLTTTYEITPNDTFRGTVSTAGDEDWVRVTLTAGESYDVSLLGAPSGAGTLADTYLRVYDAAGNLIFENDDNGATFESFLRFTADYSGNYYISAGGFGSATGSYEMSIETYSIGGDAQIADPATVEEMAEFLTDGYWGGVGASWTTSTISVNLTGLTAEGRQLARWAIEAWEAVANITFVEVTFGGDIVFDDNQSDAFAQYWTTNGNITSATVNVHTSWITGNDALVGGYGLQTYIHEIGHALGLGHQGPYNGSASYAQDAIFALDSWQMSIMSYFTQTENTVTSAGFAYVISAQMVDIFAIQSLYGAAGANSATAGDTVYGLNSDLDNYLGQLSRVLVGQESASGFYTGGPISFTLYDQGGIDTLDLSPMTMANRIDLTPGSFSDMGGGVQNVGIYLDTIIENVYAGTGSDHITGNSARNFLHGGAGNDTILGMDGHDTLQGGDGDDELHGGIGNDRLLGGIGNDLMYGGIGSDRIFGQSGLDSIYGGDGHDTIYGGHGHDLIYGEAGNDRVFGGTGLDTIYGGGGSDVLYGDSGNDILHGDTGADILYGGVGLDVLYGGAGNDTLVGGMGRDTMFGGSGADVFVFNTASESLGGTNRDTIADFEVGIDKIDISALHDDLVFVSQFSGTAGEVRYAALTARIMVDVDGDGVADFSIQLGSGLVLTEADLIL
jgi:serralysin